MKETEGQKRIWKIIEIAIIALFCVAYILLEFVKIPYSKDEFYNRCIGDIIKLACGSISAGLLLRLLGGRIFRKIHNWLYLLPCLLVAINNFQFIAYFNGKMQFMRTGAGDVFIFLAYCLLVGAFEELLFRGVCFSLVADFFPQTKKGLWLTIIVTTAIFAICHVFGGILQVSYTFLMGGLFAFCLVKTKNIWCCALVHGVYNFCGLLLDEQGLGNGVVFDLGTAIMMAVIGVLVGIFVLYNLYRYSDEERIELYRRLNLKKDTTEE